MTARTPLVFSPKKAAENHRWGFDFTAELAAEEEISSVVVTITALDSDLADPVETTLNAMGDPVVAGGIVTQRLRRGTPGQTYLITMTATTDAANILEEFGQLAIVRPPSPS